MSGPSLARLGSSKQKYLAALVCMLIICLACSPDAAFAWEGHLRPGSGLTMRIDPAINNVEAGQPLIVDVMIGGAVNVGAFQFDLIYDPAVVTVTEVALGPFVGSTGRTAQPVGPTIDNRAGTLAFGAFSFGSTAGPAGTGVLATVRFRAEGPGTSALGLQNVVVTDPMANTQPVSVEGGVVTVTAPAAASTPTMAPSPTVIPTGRPTPERVATPTQVAEPAATATPAGAATAMFTSSPIATATAKPVVTTAPTPTDSSTLTSTETPQPQAGGTGVPSPTPRAVSSRVSASTPQPLGSAAATPTVVGPPLPSPTPSSRPIGALSRPLCWMSVGAMSLAGILVGGYALYALLARRWE
jgi:hypothetical protein